MKRFCLLFLLLTSYLPLALAQHNDDDIVMRVNGKDITRGEFVYSYQKNNTTVGAVEKTTVADYAQMYVNYKLKVAEAEAQGIDTTSAFLKEYWQYRDLQIVPLLVDTVFIETIAKQQYQRMEAQLAGKPMLLPSHILLRVRQDASTEDVEKAKSKADSIYQLLLGGADFAELAKQYSQDPGSAKNGGKLPWIGPGSTIKEFEEVAYSLKKGEISKPFMSPVGVHIIFLNDVNALEPYAQVRGRIIASLKQQGIEEASAEQNINKLIAESDGKLTREDVLKDVLNQNAAENPELRYLVNEYYDGLLLYEVSKKDVWDVVENNKAALETYFAANKKVYKWDEPRFDGFVIHAYDKKTIKNAKKILKKHLHEDWKKVIRETINKDSIVCVVQGPYLCKKGENSYIDYLVFKGKEIKPFNKFKVSDVLGKKKKQPTTYTDVKSLVIADCTRDEEKKWVEKLRGKYEFVIFDDVLKTISDIE